ncbi:hypothetical protein F5148DRAFT_96949 [Russula earlei]|uniref:Uncharacterized protein n=1 Tax=Russula earlei TaxID=71964 RepID=A0ACC0ULN1_9AGAM|nr:hypothetical protein F5148DRAFT_96949 [Russula earlei]
MSSPVQPPPGTPPQNNISEVLSPGIVSIFVQGLETGLVLSQLSRWLYLQRKEKTVINVLVIFVTTVGFIETAICFASAWRIYVLGFGHLILPEWTESVHAMLSTLTAAPIQAYFIWRCYHILKKNIYLIIPLVALLIGAIVTAGWVTAWIFRMHASRRADPENYHPTANGIVYPFVAFLTLPAALDITITSILLFSLTTLLRGIHAEHLRSRVTRYMVVIWQAVIPPCICAVALLIKYIAFTNAHPGKPQMWYATIQAMLGKLYVLSLYSTLNNRIDLTNEPPVTYVSTINGSLDGIGSPMQRYVFSVHFPDREQQR